MSPTTSNAQCGIGFLGWTPKKNTDGLTRLDLVLCTSQSVANLMRHGCHCWKKPTQKHMVTMLQSLADGPGRYFPPWQLHNLTISREAIEDLTGGVTSEIYSTDILDKDKFWTNELLKVGEEFLYACSTGMHADWLEPNRSSTKRQGIHERHAYSIMDAVEHTVDGKTYRLVKVRYVDPYLHTNST
jgi:Calpain family cysteine protease